MKCILLKNFIPTSCQILFQYQGTLPVGLGSSKVEYSTFYVDVPAKLGNFDFLYTYFCPHLPLINIPISLNRTRGATQLSRGYQARPKIHVIRVVFQDQAMYARTSFRGAKTCNIGKKGCVFGHIDKFWKGHERQIKKNACKNAYLGSIFIPEKYVIRVLFVSPWTSLIPPLAI